MCLQSWSDLSSDHRGKNAFPGVTLVKCHFLFIKCGHHLLFSVRHRPGILIGHTKGPEEWPRAALCAGTLRGLGTTAIL